MKAVVMAGGKGTRLRPLTVNLPKPMVPVVGKSVMEHIVALLKKHGIVDIVVTLQFMPEVIRGYFSDGTSLEMNISYAVEDSPLGTAGSVRNVQSFLGKETFLVISGDALTDINLTDLIDFHKRKGALATVCLKSVENPLDFGLVITNAEGRIERFLEKPDWSQVFSDTI
ncbi:mannose-1-phosphate guanylyltransferase / phosphomannomutase, partial [Candidatus Hakubella thermalkaliphila]